MSAPAVGIHTHPTRKLGRRPPKRAAALDVARFITSVPDHPIVDTAPLPGGGWPLDNNDRAGDCVVAALQHTLQAQAVQLGVNRPDWTLDQILAYYQTQNPGFTSWADAGGPNDGGMDIQTFLEYLTHQGVILGFGAVDHTDPDAMRAAIYVGLALVTGETLTVAQQQQTTWDYVPGDQVWGGHATTSVAYDSGDQGLVTWGQVVNATDRFVAHQVEEAWFVLTTDLVNHPGFRDHFDLAGFAQAVANITNDKVIVPVDPPAPAPSPNVDPLADFPTQAVDPWIRHPHVWRAARIAAQQLAAWEQRHNVA